MANREVLLMQDNRVDPSSLSKTPPPLQSAFGGADGGPIACGAPPFGGSNPWVVKGAQVKALELGTQRFYS